MSRAYLAFVGLSGLACAAVASAQVWPESDPAPVRARADQAAGRAPAPADVVLAPDVERASPLADEPVRADTLSDDELKLLLEVAPETLDSIAIGPPNRGALFNGVKLEDGPLWSVTESDGTWGTRETVSGLLRALEAVETQFPDSPKLSIGHISARTGGYLRPHRSHQTGRDVDIGYYYLDGSKWYTRADGSNLDRDRTWALVKAMAPDVEFIFIDRSIQALLKEHAASIGEDSAWLDHFFEGGETRGDAVIRHAWGHTTHLHARFTSVQAERTGQRVQPLWANKRWLARLTTRMAEVERPKKSPVVKQRRRRHRS